MRIFVSTPDETGTLRKTRLTLVDCNSTNELLKRVAALCNIHHTWLIVKLKQQICNIRVVQGWPLQIYPLRQGSEIIVEILPDALRAKSPKSGSAKLGQIQEQMELQIEDNNTTGFADQKFSFFSDSTEHDWTKYFEDSLQQFLNAVRKQSIQQANNILKSEPQVNDDKVLTRIMNKKVKFLLNEIGECGRSALHWAVQDKNLDMVEFLLIKSCDPNIVSIDHYTPLQLAIVLRASSIFQTLVSHPKIDLNKVTKKGTALHIAIQNQQLTYAQKLLDCGANPQTQNLEGQTAIQLSKKLSVQLKFKSSTQPLPELPRILRGTVWRVSSFASRLKQRLLLINPFTDEFIVFEQQVPEENISIKQIKDVSEVKEKSWGMKKEYFYFQVLGIDFEIVFSLKNAKVGKGWLQSIRKCVSYCKGKKQKNDMMIPIQEQLVEVFDDVNNTIQVHKRKITKTKQKPTKQTANRISLMDLNPITQQISQKNPKSQPVLPQPPQSAPSVKSLHSQPQSPTHSPFSPPKPQPMTEQPPKLLPVFEFETTPFEVPNNISAIEEPEEYLRESQLLGSIVGSSQLMSKSILGSSLTGSRLSVFEDKSRVCFKDFQILKQLGNGSFGKVFLAKHRKLQKLFALKVLNKKKLIAKKQLKYAVGEANILKKVQSPFIIKLYYSFQTPSNLYMAIDYCPYGDLTELLLNTDEEFFTQKICKFYIAQIILAIEYLHKNKIIYRDLKPQNILIGQDGFIRLTDFNLSKENNFSMSFCGSPAYLSPEMLEKKGVGYEADIYGIGCVLYEMVVGEPPFFDQNIDILYQNIRTGKLKFPSALPKPTKSLLTSLLQRNISKRLGVKSFSQIKQHEYFENFDWQKLEKLQMKIPMEVQQKINDKNESQKLYVIKQNGFKDNDYENASQMINRIKGFSFVRDGFDFV